MSTNTPVKHTLEVVATLVAKHAGGTKETNLRTLEGLEELIQTQSGSITMEYKSIISASEEISAKSASLSSHVDKAGNDIVHTFSTANQLRDEEAKLMGPTGSLAPNIKHHVKPSSSSH